MFKACFCARHLDLAMRSQWRTSRQGLFTKGSQRFSWPAEGTAHTGAWHSNIPAHPEGGQSEGTDGPPPEPRDQETRCTSHRKEDRTHGVRSRRSGVGSCRLDAHVETAPEPFFPEKFFFTVAAVVTVIGFISLVFSISFWRFSSGLFVAFISSASDLCSSCARS